jgi:hypothetical protein
LIDKNLGPFFVNAYIEDLEFEHSYRFPLFLLIKVKEHNQEYKDIHQTLAGNKNFVYSYVAGREGMEYLYMYVFECPSEFIKDYERFLQGTYSKFSPSYKSRFNRTVPNREGRFVESPIYGALFRTAKIKEKIERIIGETLGNEQEYWGVYEPRIEIFRYQPSKTTYA